MSYDAGSLDQRVTLQSRTPVQDAIGGESQGPWTEVAAVWASVRYPSGLETVRADAPIGVTRCSVRIVWRAGVEVGMRLLHDGRVLDIKSVLPDATGRDHLDLACETGANQG